MVLLAKNSALREKMGANAKKDVKKYYLDPIIAKWQDINTKSAFYFSKRTIPTLVVLCYYLVSVLGLVSSSKLALAISLGFILIA